MSESVMALWVIYERPADYPDGYVVRRWHVVRGKSDPVPDGAPIAVVPSLEEARSWVPPHAVCLARDATDDPVIVESWV